MSAEETHRSEEGREEGRVKTRLRALRAFSFPLSALPVLVATAAVRPVGEWRWDLLAASVAGVVLLHAAGNLFNDYFDFRSGVDRKVEGDEGRPGRLLVRGELAPRDVLVEALVCLVLALGLAAYLVWVRGTVLLAFGGAAVLALYAYTGPPFRLKYRALGEPVIFLVFGPLLMTGAAWAQTGRWEWAALLLSLPVGFATTAVLVGNNLRDSEEDGESGIVTLVQLAGVRAVQVLYVLLVAGCAAGLAGLALAGFGPPALAATPLLILLKGVCT